MREIFYTDEARRELIEEAAWHDEHGSLGGAHTSRDPERWLRRLK